MRLKESVTKEQLNELGFYNPRGTWTYIADITKDNVYTIRLEINFRTCEMSLGIMSDETIYNYSLNDFLLNDILLKMFQLGYIEESEEA